MTKQPSSPAKARHAVPAGKPSQLVLALRQRQWARFAVLWLSSFLILMSFFFSTVLKNFSYVEIFPQELVLPVFMHALTALLITLAVFWLPWLGSYTSKLIASVILALSMIGYEANLHAVEGLIKAFMPGLTDSDPMQIVSIIYLVMLLALATFISKGLESLVDRAKRVRHRDVQLGVFALIVYLFIFPAMSLAMILPDMVSQSKVQAPELTKQSESTGSKDKPDIYYIVLDRYTNSEVLKSQFNHDNSRFIDFLQANNFTVNNGAYSNYPYTTMSIASTMNAQYTNDLVAPFKNSKAQNRTLYHNLIWQSSVVKALKKEGYQYQMLGSWYGATYNAPLADYDHISEHQLTVFGVNKRLRGIEAIEFRKSPYLQFAQLPNVSWWPAKYVNNDHTNQVRKQLNYLDDLSGQEPGGRFIFAHILVPHDPYVFNADGSLSAYQESNSIDKPIKEKYVNQVQFINSHMEDLVSRIQERSGGKAVIILNSDEGPYPQMLNDTFKQPQAVNRASIDAIIAGEDMRQWSDDYFKMKFGILQAVHMPQAPKEDMAHLSSVNVFRILLNNYFGYDLEYLPECQFGLTNGSQNEFNYVDVTNRFNPNPDKSCAQKQVQPSKR